MGIYVVGVDGCRAGWVTCRLGCESLDLEFRVSAKFSDLAERFSDARCIAVDIPIGLRDDGGERGCDVEARAALAYPRAFSVFRVPARRLLQEATHGAANRISSELFGTGISLQSFHIMPKIREVDSHMTEVRQSRIFEVHPEVCFWAMASRPMLHGKKARAGYDERAALLTEHLGVQFPNAANWRDFWGLRGEGLGRDDVIDATVAAWSALRVVRGIARKFPTVGEVDRRGLRMEIVY